MKFLQPGTVVRWKSESWVIQDFVDLSTARVKAVKGRRTLLAPAAEFVIGDQNLTRPSFRFIDEEAWDRASAIYKVIEPLTRQRRNSSDDLNAAAAALGVGLSQLYSYLKTWRTHKRVSALARKPRSDKGASRLPDPVRTIIEDVVQNFYLVEERPTEAETVAEVQSRCKAAGLPEPSKTPVFAAIAAIPEKDKAKGREGAKHARERFEPYRGSFPGADFPLAVVQIDHTPADVILVDDLHRRPLGRAFLTLVIDVCTRMVCGFSLSLEAPSTMSAALALQHAILPKTDWLKERGLLEPALQLGVSDPWPIWGRPRKVHADNAKEFRGSGLKRGCAEYGITLENRPKGQPQYGGHVERSFRTFMKATQRLKGTTFSNVAKRIKYNSEKKATLTVSEYEKWFGIFIVYRYHQRVHSAIGMPPVKLYEKYILGDENTLPVGLPAPEDDPRRLMLDFMPFEERTVQQVGVVIDHIPYFDDVLRKWVASSDPKDKNKGRTFIFARDPRDLSYLYFLDPDTNNYVPIPYRNRGRPPISYWEHQAALREIRKDPNRKPNEEMIFQGIALARALEDEAEKTTNQTRREAARRKGWKTAQEKARKAVAKSTKDDGLHVGASEALPAANPSKEVHPHEDDDDDAMVPLSTFSDFPLRRK